MKRTWRFDFSLGSAALFTKKPAIKGFLRPFRALGCASTFLFIGLRPMLFSPAPLGLGMGIGQFVRSALPLALQELVAGCSFLFTDNCLLITVYMENR
mgnify:CR=1 FL=1